MRRLGTVIQPLVRGVIDAWAKIPDCHAVAAQLVGHDDAWQAPEVLPIPWTGSGAF